MKKMKILICLLSVFTTARCSQSCGFFWSISSWSLRALSSSGGCASAVSPSSAASHPRASDLYHMKHFVFINVLLFFFFFNHLGCDLNFDGDRHCHQQNELFLNVNFTVRVPAIEDQLVMHWILMARFLSPHLLNVTSCKQWTPLTVCPLSRALVNINCVLVVSAVIVFLTCPYLFVEIPYSMK